MTTTETAVFNPVVSNDEWLAARKALLREEKALTRRSDELARKRRELPWVRLEGDYVFDGPDGPVTLADLFAGRTQLAIYHFMFSPDWKEGCPSCSMAADHMDAMPVHLAHGDTTLVMVSRASIDKIEAFRKRMGWSIPWVSSYHNSFNRDYHVSFTKEEAENGTAWYNFRPSKFPSVEAQGMSVFRMGADGSIFHTYSAYGRGVEPLLGVYNVLDMTPKGRDEDQHSYPMAWIRHHDRYPESKPARSAGECCHAKEQSA